MAAILVLDDDDAMREALTALLERAGYSVLSAGSCAQTRALLQNSAPDLLLLDVSLPDGDGFSLCRELRGKGLQTPVLFLTVYESEEQVVKGLDSGGDDYITKPFRAQELLSRIRARLRRTGDSGEIQQAGDLRIDTETHTVQLNGQELALTKTEYQLLVTLAANAGRPVLREVLLGRIWDDAGVFVDDNTLSVHINRLRQKIGTDRIETLRGIGYRLIQ